MRPLPRREQCGWCRFRSDPHLMDHTGNHWLVGRIGGQHSSQQALQGCRVTESGVPSRGRAAWRHHQDVTDDMDDVTGDADTGAQSRPILNVAQLDQFLARCRDRVRDDQQWLVEISRSTGSEKAILVLGAQLLGQEQPTAERVMLMYCSALALLNEQSAAGSE